CGRPWRTSSPTGPSAAVSSTRSCSHTSIRSPRPGTRPIALAPRRSSSAIGRVRPRPRTPPRPAPRREHPGARRSTRQREALQPDATPRDEERPESPFLVVLGPRARLACSVLIARGRGEPPMFGLTDLLGRPAHRIDSATAARLVGDGALLLDVRTPTEFSTGAPEGAVNIPVQELAAR